MPDFLILISLKIMNLERLMVTNGIDHPFSLEIFLKKITNSHFSDISLPSGITDYTCSLYNNLKVLSLFSDLNF